MYLVIENTLVGALDRMNTVHSNNTECFYLWLLLTVYAVSILFYPSRTAKTRNKNRYMSIKNDNIAFNYFKFKRKHALKKLIDYFYTFNKTARFFPHGRNRHLLLQCYKKFDVIFTLPVLNIYFNRSSCISMYKWTRLTKLNWNK